MRKHKISAIFAVTIIFAAFTLGFFLGNNRKQDRITVSVPVALMSEPTTVSNVTAAAETKAVTFPISINHAGKEEFMALPGIGEVLAQRILNYRQEHGNFDSPEELLNVEGIGEKRLEEIMEWITTGG